MKKVAIAPTVVVIESTLDQADDTGLKIKSVIAELHQPVQVRVGTSREALSALSNKQDVYFEPCLVVTDREGLRPQADPVVGKIRRAFRRPKVILYSMGATPANFREWKKEGLVDDFVPKQQPQRALQSACRKALRAYFRNNALNSFRDCLITYANPWKKYIVIDGEPYSPWGMFQEMLNGTDLGHELIRAEKKLITTAERNRPR